MSLLPTNPLQPLRPLGRDPSAPIIKPRRKTADGPDHTDAEDSVTLSADAVQGTGAADDDSDTSSQRDRRPRPDEPAQPHIDTNG